MLATYAALYRRMGCSDPDAGFDEAYTLGRRGLKPRARAIGLDPQRQQIIAALIQQAEAAAEDEIPAWIEGHPRRILSGGSPLSLIEQR